jgi:nucleotide-binding universal stress UspA family protein
MLALDGPILAPLDGSSLAEKALPWATMLARRWHAPLVLARILDSAYPVAVSLSEASLASVMLDAELQQATGYLEKTASELRTAFPELSIATETPAGHAAGELLDLERRLAVRLVVMTTHGRTGLGRWARGSVAEKIVRHGSAPVLTVRPWERDLPLRLATASDLGLRVLVPVDGSSHAEEVLDLAESLARGPGGALIVTQIVRTGDERAVGAYYAPRVEQERRAARAYVEAIRVSRQAAGVAVHGTVRDATDVASEIIDLSRVEGADLIVMSTHGRGALGRLLYGSVADRVAHAGKTPVLLYRPRAARADEHAVRPAYGHLETAAEPSLPSLVATANW